MPGHHPAACASLDLRLLCPQTQAISDVDLLVEPGISPSCMQRVHMLKGDAVVVNLAHMHRDPQVGGRDRCSGP